MNQRCSKKPRTRRAKTGHAIAITSRDLSILTFLGLVGYCSSEQVAREFFPSADRARRRLRQLLDAGLVAVTCSSSTSPNLVSLTRGGLGVVADSHPDLAPRLRLAGAIQLAGVEHHLVVVDLRLHAAALGEVINMSLVRWTSANSDLGRELGLSAYHLQPDGLAEFQTLTDNIVIAMEADCGTEPVSTVLARKLAKYSAAAAGGSLDGLWLAVTGGARRLAAVADLVQQAGLAGFARVLRSEQLTQRPVVPVPLVGGEGENRAAGPKTLSAAPSFPVSVPGVQTPKPAGEGRADGWADRGGGTR